MTTCFWRVLVRVDQASIILTMTIAVQLDNVSQVTVSIVCAMRFGMPSYNDKR